MAQGGPGSVAGLYLRHADELRRLIVGIVDDRSLAEDVLQSAFAKAVEQRGPDRPESAKAWLYRVAVNEALVLRRRKRVAAKAHAELAWMAQARGNPRGSDPLARAEAIQAVRHALEQLPAAQRDVVYARLYEGKRFAEIARDFKLPIGTVLTRMRRALERLRTSLRDLGEEPGASS